MDRIEMYPYASRNVQMSWIRSKRILSLKDPSVLQKGSPLEVWLVEYKKIIKFTFQVVHLCRYKYYALYIGMIYYLVRVGKPIGE